MDQRAKDLVGIGDSLFAKRSPMLTFWQQVSEEFYAMRADFTSSFSPGEDIASHHMDGYPELARETLGNAPDAMLRQGNWFEIQTGFEELDEDPANAEWLEYATKRLRRLVYDPRSKFLRAAKEADHDYVSFGNAVVSVEESADRTHLYYRDWHLRDCAWMENASGTIDCLHRKDKWTARNLIRRWPKTAPTEVKRIAEKDPMALVEVRHVCMPAEEYYADDVKQMKTRRRAERNNSEVMPYVSLYIAPEHNVILSEGEMPIFGYVVPRWRTISGYPYAFSPATTIALPDARMLQSVARVVIEAAEKQVDPPMLAVQDAIREDLNVFAGGVTWIDADYDEKTGEALRQLQQVGDTRLGVEFRQDLRNLMAEAFLLNKLTFPVMNDMRAEQVAILNQQFRRAIIPFFTPIENEYHSPLLDASLQIATRNRAFNMPLPDALEQYRQEGGELVFSFENPLNTAEGRAAVSAFQESMAIITAASGIDQSIAAGYDFKKMTADAVKGTGAPADWKQDEKVEEAATEEANQTAGLIQAGQALQAGAGVAGQVADATLKMQQAGLVAA
jgi:hypothetical protein